MKIIVFQGQSQFDVLRESSRRTARAFRELGHEVFIMDMLLWNSSDYLDIVNEFKPDFTFGSNPVCYFYDDELHFEKTKVPHIVRIGDSPYYHAFNRALRNPNHPMVYTVTAETSFITQMKDIGFERFTRLKTFASYKMFNEDEHAYRPFPIVFFGSIEPPELIMESVKQNISGQLGTKVVEFLSIIPEWMQQHGIFLPKTIDQMFSEFMDLDKLVSNEEKIVLLQQLYPYIDKYYRNYCRTYVLREFASTGIPMYVFGNDYLKTRLGNYNNVRVFKPVPFKECLEIYAKSKMVLNISPMFFYAHERISHSITNGAVLCSSLMPDLVDEIPELLESSLFYTWGNIAETAETAKRVLNDSEFRLHLVDKGQKISEQHFNPVRNAEEIISIYQQAF